MITWGIVLLVLGLLVWAVGRVAGIPPALTIGAVVAIIGVAVLIVGVVLLLVYNHSADSDVYGSMKAVLSI